MRSGVVNLENDEVLNRLQDRLTNDGVKTESAPELLGQRPAKYMMCHEPSGIRVEFIWPGD